MYLYIWMFTIVVIVSPIICSHSKHDADGPDLKVLKNIMSGLKSSDEDIDSEDVDRELKTYYKKAAKKEEKYFKKRMRDALSEEEKAEVKYYEDLLTKIKHVNDGELRDKKMRPREKKEDLSHLELVLKQVRDLKKFAIKTIRG